MRILYVNATEPDYLADSLFHGFYNLLGKDFNHLHDYDFMYKNDTNLEKLKAHQCKGFTIHNNLLENLNDNTDIEYKIRKHYFDYVVYGCIDRHHEHLNLVLKNYKKSEICYIDGSDTVIPGKLSKHYDPNILFFKRELYLDLKKFPYKNIYPISFSIPKEKITKDFPRKNKMMSFINPIDKTTYIYEKEEDYYDDYKTSYFGLTMKKAGWDCLRHYEILMNYCLPYFKDIENCPENILTTLPKKELIRAKEIFENFSEKEYYELLDYVFEYTKNNLTTEHSAKYVLDVLMKNNKR